MSFLGPTSTEFQGKLEAKLSKLSWCVARVTKYFAPAALYRFIRASGSNFSAFHDAITSLYPFSDGWP